MIAARLAFAGSSLNGGEPSPSAIPALTGVIEQIEGLLLALDDEQYARKPVGLVQSSIGGHVRHCLDHFDALLSAVKSRTLCYDGRSRGTIIETHRLAALGALRIKAGELAATDWRSPAAPISLTVLLSADEPPAETITTLDRELAFVLSHTIHHCALIGLMAASMGLSLPDSFGCAPSTLAYRKARLCAR